MHFAGVAVYDDYCFFALFLMCSSSLLNHLLLGHARS